MFNQEGQTVGRSQVNIGNLRGFSQENQNVSSKTDLLSLEPFPDQIPEGLKTINPDQLPNRDWLVAVSSDSEIVFDLSKKRTKVAFADGGMLFVTDDGELRGLRGYKLKNRVVVGYKGMVVLKTVESEAGADVDLDID